MAHRRQRGFTLIELLVIVAIMGVMVTVGVISFETGRGSTQVFAATRDVMAMIRRARSVALVTQKPVVLVYSNNGASDGEEVCARVSVQAAKLFSSANSSTAVVRTLAGDIVGDEPQDETRADDSPATRKKDAEKADGAAASDDAGGETLEDVLSPEAISPDVVKGIRLKVLKEDEELHIEETRRSKISIFSTADSVSRSYGGNAKSAADKSDATGEKGTAAGDDADSATEEDVQVVFAANGTVSPAHKVWIYAQGSRPDKGLCVTVDRFGEPKCSDLEGQ